MEERQRLLDRIGDINDMSLPRPLVTLDEFFEGNDDPGSIGYNLPDPLSPQEFRQALDTVEARKDVDAVMIEVKDLEDPEGWPSTDTVWVITTAEAESVPAWLPESLRPDDVIDGFPPSGIDPYELPPGFRAVGLFYD